MPFLAKKYLKMYNNFKQKEVGIYIKNQKSKNNLY